MCPLHTHATLETCVSSHASKDQLASWLSWYGVTLVSLTDCRGGSNPRWSVSKTRVQKNRASEHKRPDSEKNHVSKDQHVFEISHFAPIFSHLIFPFRPVAASSCRTPCSLSKPYCNRYGSSSSVDPISAVSDSLHQLQQNTLFLMTPLPAQLLIASRALQQIDLELNRLESQFLCILQLQLQHSLTLWALCQRSTSIDSYDFTYAYPAVQMRGLTETQPPRSKVWAAALNFWCHIHVMFWCLYSQVK